MRGFKKKFLGSLAPEFNGRTGEVVDDEVDPKLMDDSIVMVRLAPVQLAPTGADATQLVRVGRVYLELDTSGQAPSHYSVDPKGYKQVSRINSKGLSGNRRGMMIHQHPGGPNVPNGETCGGNPDKCTKAHFPKPVSKITTVSDDGNILLHERDESEIMVVCWNPWLMLYFQCHLNVEVVVSSINVILYLFKIFQYIMKGTGIGDVNGLTITRRDAPPDEVGDFYRVKETSSTEAFRRHASMNSVTFTPAVRKLVPHGRRARSTNPKDKDDGLSDLEVYMARPPLPELDSVQFEPFNKEWLSSRKLAGAPNNKAGRLANDPICLMHYAGDGRAVYIGTDPTSLRENSQTIGQCYYWRRATATTTTLPVWRIKSVPIKQGDVFYLRKLLKRFAARTFDELHTSSVTGEVVSAQQRCREEGDLIDDEAEAEDVLQEAVACADAPVALRSLFVQLANEGYAMGALIQHREIRAAMAADFGAGAAADAQMLDALQDLFSVTFKGDCEAMGRMLPDVVHEYNGMTESDQEYWRYDRAEQRALATTILLDGPPGACREQTRVVHWALTGEYDETGALPERLEPVEFVEPVGVEIMVAHGDAGVGKSNVAKRALCEMRARGVMARACAFSNLAARNFSNGTTLHWLGCISVKSPLGSIEPINVVPFGTMTRERRDMLRWLRFIIYDEAFSGERDILEAFVTFLEEIGCNVRLLVMGDSQQIQPVIPNATLAQKRDASLESSVQTYHDAIRVLLKTQHRQAADKGWGDLVRSVGNGTAESLTDHAFHWPEKAQAAVALDVLHHVFHEADELDVEASMRRAIEWLFGRVDVNGRASATGRLCTNNLRHRGTAAQDAYKRGAKMRAVLCATNVLKDRWNELVRTMLAEDAALHGLPPGRMYHAAMGAANIGDDSGEHIFAEQALQDDVDIMGRGLDKGLPLTELQIAIGDTVLLAKNMCSSSGLVKNALFTVEQTRAKSLVLADSQQRRWTVPRARFIVKLNHEGTISIAQKQVPVTHAWALTVNKSQGQTCEQTLLDLRSKYFEHGQAYTAVGRTPTAAVTGAFVNDACSMPRQGGGSPVPIMAAICHSELLARG